MTEDVQEIETGDVEVIQTPVYNELTEEKLQEAVNLSKDSTLTKAKIAEMIGCKHEEVAAALARFQNLHNRGITAEIRKGAREAVLNGKTLRQFSEEAEIDYDLIVEAMAPLV